MSGFVEIEDGTASSDEFLGLMKKFKEFRVKFQCENAEPFKYHYFMISKKELRDSIRTNKMEVTYQIRYNSKVDERYGDIVYIMKMRMTLLE